MSFSGSMSEFSRHPTDKVQTNTCRTTMVLNDNQIDQLQTASSLFFQPRRKSIKVGENDVHSILGKGKVCIRAKWPIRPELILVSIA